MDVWQKISVGNTAHIGVRHRQERERCGLTPNTLAAMLILSGANTKQIEAFERSGKPLKTIDTYWSRLAAKTGMDVLYILTGDFYPVRLAPEDAEFWAVFTHLSPTSRAAVLTQARRLFEAESEADEDVQLCLRHGERYRGIPIGDLDQETRDIGLAEMRRFVDAALNEDVAQYLAWLRYEADGVCRFGLVDGLVQESDEAKRLATLASLLLSRYWWFDVYWEKE